ncbi:hypothetical protein [Sphingomonas sp. Leaf28]|uniref:8-oxoguanine DNA glycosylase OGG fold protein n=1 Tax=Sphingomonas sp. Leaf28 TaxID=1735695 RepID=UPI0006F4AE52|nr:hypothetical protein [Sphingomonas sp. Leaf28]KQN09056.1 hypothetical protein ASE79_14485 [Sphingomonas sp. Leaf28]
MNFAEALQEFLTAPEEGQKVRPHVWDNTLPFIDSALALGEKPLLRSNVFAAFKEGDEKGSVFALVWGYPDGHTNYMTKGAPVSLQVAMRDAHYIGDVLGSLREYGTTKKNPLSSLNEIPGLFTASTSKLAYFAGLDHRGDRCLILDQQVMRAIMSEDYRELDDLRAAILKDPMPGRIEQGREVRAVNAPNSYPRYIEEMGKLAKSLGSDVDAEDVERFLFELGRDIHRTTNTRKWRALSKSVVIGEPPAI